MSKFEFQHQPDGYVWLRKGAIGFAISPEEYEQLCEKPVQSSQKTKDDVKDRFRQDDK